MTAAVPDFPPPYRTVVFDCDSTLSAIEGIDELAGELTGELAGGSAGELATATAAARRAQIAALTERAMAGELGLEEVYGRRLALLRPSRAAIDAVGRLYVERAVPEARELCAALAALGKRVVIVSGGIRAAVLALARALAIPERDVFAVEVFHDARGEYAGFDERSPLATQDGKRAIVERLAAETDASTVATTAGTGNSVDARGVVCIGDGMTDLVGARAARRFVAYGGVVRRASVFALARVTCDAQSLAALAPLLFDTHELERLRALPAHRRLVAAVDSLTLRGS